MGNDYEVVGWLHSWDTPEFLTNYMLFKIQRHPDHHTNAARPYQILRTFKDAPALPTGYAGCIVLSWFPPLWRYVMDWRAERGEVHLPGWGAGCGVALQRGGQ